MTHFYGWARALDVVVPTTGVLTGPAVPGQYPGTFVLVFYRGTTTLAPIYAGQSVYDVKNNPFLTDVNGGFQFYGPESHYDLLFSLTPTPELFTPVALPDVATPLLTNVSAGSDTVLRSDTPSQASVQAALTAVVADLNDIKTRLRFAGILTTPPVRVSRTSATQLRMLVPVTGAPNDVTYLEWRLKTNATNTWSIQGCYGRNLADPTADVQISDSTDTSVWECPWQIGVADAPAGSFEYVGQAHGFEALLTSTFLLDGADLSTLAVGDQRYGRSCVVYQTVNLLLPKNFDGSANGVTVCGSRTLRHTFDEAGLLVEHTAVMDAGYQGISLYAGAVPTHVVNINRFQIGTLPVRTPAAPVTPVAIDYGTEASTYTAWGTEHHYRITMTLPSGGPVLSWESPATGPWYYAGPEKMWFYDRPEYGKCYVNYQGSTYANRRNSGSTSHSQRYSGAWV